MLFSSSNFCPLRPNYIPVSFHTYSILILYFFHTLFNLIICFSKFFSLFYYLFFFCNSHHCRFAVTLCTFSLVLRTVNSATWSSEASRRFLGTVNILSTYSLHRVFMLVIILLPYPSLYILTGFIHVPEIFRIFATVLADSELDDDGKRTDQNPLAHPETLMRIQMCAKYISSGSLLHLHSMYMYICTLYIISLCPCNGA